MKTTKQIHQMYEMNNESEKDISNDIWYSLEEVKEIIELIRTWKGNDNWEMYDVVMEAIDKINLVR